MSVSHGVSTGAVTRKTCGTSDTTHEYYCPKCRVDRLLTILTGTDFTSYVHYDIPRAPRDIYTPMPYNIASENTQLVKAN